MQKKSWSLALLRIVLVGAVCSAVLFGVRAQEHGALWPAWENKDIASLSDDNSGATFALSTEVLSPAGSATLQVTPGGAADETKLAFPVSGAALQEWAAYEQLQLEVYLPESNTLNANRFFLGMAQVTDGWAWVDGVFGQAQGEDGWIQVLYTPSAAMRSADPDGDYVLYFAFFNENAQGKSPLTEAFYLGSIALLTPIVADTSAADSRYQAEVDTLLAMDDAALIEAVARATFDYFWYEANPENGLVKDRSTAASPASIAAVGFGLSALTIAADRGWISADLAYERALVTLQTFASGFAAGENGFFYHFIDMQSGERMWASELSSIDTALLIAGALSAGQYFAGTEVAQLAQQLYENVDWQWMTRGRDHVAMGWTPEGGFLGASWDHFDESLLLYVLAIGSPTYPLAADIWASWRRPVNVRGEYIYLPGEPLFVYQYPLAWLDLRSREDAYANYFNNTTRACQRNRQVSAASADTVATYQYGVWGISASDGPNGYRAYGASDANHDGTIAPYAATACLPFTPAAALESMRALLTHYGAQVWREYGFVSAINAQVNWFSDEHIGIDQGDILLMIANYQDGFMWELMAQNTYIQNALTAMGFVESRGDYAVTPAYLAQVQGR
ncbi:MAG: hypothetical protein HXY40_05260 [Chloroflexi bacterium]|nr:hypothetical protein [Chloroflexota bacterium]